MKRLWKIQRFVIKFKIINIETDLDNKVILKKWTYVVANTSTEYETSLIVAYSIYNEIKHNDTMTYNGT